MVIKNGERGCLMLQHFFSKSVIEYSLVFKSQKQSALTDWQLKKILVKVT